MRGFLRFLFEEFLTDLAGVIIGFLVLVRPLVLVLVFVVPSLVIVLTLKPYNPILAFASAVFWVAACAYTFVKFDLYRRTRR
jgi:hypothetical protein